MEVERRRDGGHNPWLLLATVLTGLFATGFSVTILAVSIPEIADDLGSTTAVLTFVITGPFLAIALAMPLLGKLGDVRGHRRIYLLGLSGFAVATACTAASRGARRRSSRCASSAPSSVPRPDPRRWR